VFEEKPSVLSNTTETELTASAAMEAKPSFKKLRLEKKSDIIASYCVSIPFSS
jgi:hypothetical protein